MRKTGVLLIHGFGGDVGEISLLRDHLMQKGYPVACPLLQGRAKHQESDMTNGVLLHASYRDWITSAEESCLTLSKQCERIVAVGFSMGGLIAANLWNYGFAGLVTVNTPIYYWNVKVIAQNLFSDFRTYSARYLSASRAQPLQAMLEFQKLLTHTKPMFGNITCRTLVVQTMDDDTVNGRSADYIRKRVPAEVATCRPAKGGHLIFQSSSGPVVCGVIEQFIESLLDA